MILLSENSNDNHCVFVTATRDKRRSGCLGYITKLKKKRAKWLTKMEDNSNLKTAMTNIVCCDIPTFIYLVHSSPGQKLLPRGKGHKRTSRSLTRCPTSRTPHLHTKDSHSTGITLLCVGSLTSHRIINTQGIVRRDLWLIVLIRED